jgi:hypothetical protein
MEENRIMHALFVTDWLFLSNNIIFSAKKDDGENKEKKEKGKKRLKIEKTCVNSHIKIL